MPYIANDAEVVDTGFGCLSMLLRFHGLAVEPEQLKHQFGKSGEHFDDACILRTARDLGLKARAIQADWGRLSRLQLPAIARHKDGHYFIIGKAADDEVLVHDPLEARPLTWKRRILEDAWDGDLICMQRQARAGESGRKFDITWFFPSIIKYRHILRDVFVATFFVQLFALITPLFFLVVIDKVLVHHGLSTLDVLVFALVVVSLFDIAIGGLRTYMFSHTTNRIDVELGAKLFRHLLHLPIPFFEARQIGHIEAQMRQMESVRGFLTGPPLTTLIDALFVFVFLGLMYYYSPQLTFIVLAAVPAYGAISFFITPLLQHRLQEKYQRGAENQAFLVESVGGIETLKAMAMEPRIQERWEEQLAAYVKSAFRVTTLSNASNQGAQLVQKIAVALTLWFGAKLVIGGELTVGQLVAFNMLSGRVHGPILRLVQLWQQFQQFRISLAKIGDILNTQPEPAHNPTRASLPRIKGDIGFDAVSFRYLPDRPRVLDKIDLKIPAGQVVGIIGPSGSGKSTLTKLLQHFYVPESGRVSIDGVDLAAVDTAWLRRQVGVVLQDSTLFNRSVRDNIALADSAMPIEAVIRAATLAGAHEFVAELPDGYDTLVGERGGRLSGGQRQRIAIARALATDPRILILDEATSALDFESETMVLDNLRNITEGRTVIIITHRIAMLRDADRIITMENGRPVEDGTHDQLVQLGGRYAALYRHQGRAYGQG
ncbi:type I secretion system permease/ATPase [Varunaivibrio sulfuroxidans]|uniref:Subfamily B ATP-binding cassette protein HlyB/CyaB n=1 Tax=Varunaivibrio sulfuroxidans TaxID=1773489 RepID=A0A4R3JCF5_9PROT|nr:type I secretion system permease/ATPase [Varunaivibrio sulfuroxidans]TCS63055.1 subfamily B ATP-binding cassette protein HlyB/CyaB [Varunaivibrio sulfuroxidans]WES31873.1 type I secretion system permease/ATPase [Varunaivibrio sulfuroxidans]